MERRVSSPSLIVAVQRAKLDKRQPGTSFQVNNPAVRFSLDQFNRSALKLLRRGCYNRIWAQMSLARCNQGWNVDRTQRAMFARLPSGRFRRLFLDIACSVELCFSSKSPSMKREKRDVLPTLPVVSKRQNGRQRECLWQLEGSFSRAASAILQALSFTRPTFA